ncbi:GerMN domain-containing protein [Ktedonobacter racemifer]|uniref:Lipoprotein LpqB, GerMN domain protein n=1 Tax=Ktedonobacter racemifer DSM 44963 TaxID=485913 RepID=D6TGM4_KTERA|nr:GerMN domain-containing protein [Ktedonobacter racemifer]EFH90736.1 Lipoprotein LpqB, GerMN domain protein [Ktedonobacter racemifer DSM 44963]
MSGKSQRRLVSTNSMCSSHLFTILTLSLLFVLAAFITACASDGGTGRNIASQTSTTSTATPASSSTGSTNGNDSTANNGGQQPTNTGTSQPGKEYHVKVYFSKHSQDSMTLVYPVNRTTTSQAVATASLQYLIAGPNASEQSQGYYTELTSMLQGASTCEADFTIKLNTKGSTPETGTATVQFCRDLSSAGIGMDARVQSQINATLKQFPTISKVIILTRGGNCFGDESGANMCLR